MNVAIWVHERGMYTVGAWCVAVLGNCVYYQVVMYFIVHAMFNPGQIYCAIARNGGVVLINNEASFCRVLSLLGYRWSSKPD